MVILPNRRKYMVGRVPSGATIPFSECVVTLVSDSVTYTGSACTVEVVVTWEGATLAVNIDYTLSWANNVNVGPATVTITGIGQFSGSVTRTFYVVSSYEASESWTFDLNNSTGVSVLSLSGIIAADICLGSNDNELFILSSGGTVRKVTIPENGTIANATVGNAISVETGADSFFFCDSGRKVLFSKVASSSTYLWLISLTNPYDVSSVSDSLDTESANLTVPMKMYFRDMSLDGLHLFGHTTTGAYRYDLTAPFYVSGATYDDTISAGSILFDGNQYIAGMKLSQTGGMLLASQLSGKIFQSTLSTPFLLSSATKGNSMTTVPWDGPFVVNRSANRLYQVMAGSQYNTISEYSLS